MTPSQILHTFARRYCIEKHAQWTAAYASLSREGRDRVAGGYSPEAYATFPRYNVLHAILLEVEALDYDELPRLEELRDLLLLAGRCAETAFTKGSSNSIERIAQEEERARFVEAVQTANLNRPAEPLPYRRVLRTDEVTALRDRLTKT